MRNKLFSTLACGMLILAMLACSLPGGQDSNQPDLAATITAQALILQGLNNTAISGATALPANTALPSDTPLPAATAQPTNTSGPANTPRPTDTPMPAAPSKPADFAVNGSGTTIAFAWTDKSVNESGFRIYQEGVAAPVVSVDAHPATGGMSYNWTGQACGFKGKFSIRAYNDAGESDSSKSVEGVTVPCQPTNLVAHGSGNAISFNWAVTNPHNEAGFRIYQQGVAAPVASRGPNLGSGGTIFDLTGLACNLVATYSVRAFNSAGESPDTNLIQAETVPCPPSGLTITGASKDVVTYSWTDNSSNETGFHIYVDDVLYLTVPAHAGTGVLNNNAVQHCGENHVYSVRAFNPAGESGSSEHVGATTLAC